MKFDYLVFLCFYASLVIWLSVLWPLILSGELLELLLDCHIDDWWFRYLRDLIIRNGEVTDAGGTDGRTTVAWTTIGWLIGVLDHCATARALLRLILSVASDWESLLWWLALQVTWLIGYLWSYHMIDTSYDNAVLLLDLTQILEATPIPVLLVQSMEWSWIGLVHLTDSEVRLWEAAELLHEYSVSTGTLLAFHGRFTFARVGVLQLLHMFIALLDKHRILL